MEKKYVVLKKEDFESIINCLQYEGQTQNALTAVIKDAVVIRTQDVFAAPGLYGYANAITSGIEVANDLLAEETTSLGVKPGVQRSMEYLREVAQYFIEKGDEAATGLRKVPD